MRILRKVSDEFWWDVARKCDYATFYHTPIWKEIAKRSFPDRYQDQTFGAILANGVRVVFPLLSMRRQGPLHRLESTFAGCYGGIIADGPVAPCDAARIYRRACAWSTSSLYFLDNPLGPSLPDEIRSKFSPVISDAAYSIKLDTDFDTIFSRFSRSRRTAYRSGIKQGVQIRLATSIDEYQAYYTNYRDAVERWGEDDGYGYKWNLFEQIYYLSKIYPENIKLWLMIVDQQIVGGRLIVYWNQQASLWNGTAHRDFLHYDVMPVADTEIIRDAIIRGYGSFDFNTSGENTGVITYKQRFGSSETPLTGWIYENPLVASARAAYQRLRNGLSPTDGVIASGVVIAILQGI